uniref:Integrase n=1 Tax=Siphoviridae sp. ctWDo30 TaxID=2826360 RepID=A0A8S5N5Y0_9CAUD|nr:MAG TPA: Integrase [Siphoviridae sp. ctWDo30]
MPTGKKLPSGSWRCQVFSHCEPQYDKSGHPVIDPKTGKQKQKRIYESFTSNDPTRNGKKEVEFAAAEFALQKKTRKRPANMSLSEAIDKYINSSDAVLSPTTIEGYNVIKKHAFKTIMDIKIKDITKDLLQQAVNEEAKRPKTRGKKGQATTISPKTVKNEYGLITAVLNMYCPSLDCTVRLPERPVVVKELLPPETILEAVKGDVIELPVLLAMWLSFSMSEVRGIKKSLSIKDGYITIQKVIVDVNNIPVEKLQAKTRSRVRKLKIPEYIQNLIDATDPNEDYLVPMSGAAIYNRFVRILKKNGLPHMSFHDLRHVNASVMALLRVPDKYAQERGGWKTDQVMKKVYVQTFSENREEVDQLIDSFFERKMQHEMQHEKNNP